MKGDRILITEQHTARARELCEIVMRERVPGMVVTVAGESGAGKSELASELSRLLNEAGITSEVIQQDDYFVFPPKTNHEMRRRNIEQVGPYEVKLGLLDSNLRSFKRGENPIYKPLVDYDADRIEWVERDLGGVDVVVVEGTYCTSLRFADLRVFINRTYEHTAEHRRERNREAHEPFMDEVLIREHRVISSHRDSADVVVDATFESLADCRPGYQS